MLGINTKLDEATIKNSNGTAWHRMYKPLEDKDESKMDALQLLLTIE